MGGFHFPWFLHSSSGSFGGCPWCRWTFTSAWRSRDRAYQCASVCYLSERHQSIICSSMTSTISTWGGRGLVSIISSTGIGTGQRKEAYAGWGPFRRPGYWFHIDWWGFELSNLRVERDHSGAEGRDRNIDLQVEKSLMDHKILGAVKQIVRRSANNHGVAKHLW